MWKGDPVEQSDPAWKLAAAADAAGMSGDMDAFERAFAALKPNSRIIARAYAVCLTKPPFTAHEASRLILYRYLEVALMEEHVAAQRRMGRTINRLTFFLVLLTAALVFFGVVDLIEKSRPREAAASAPAFGGGLFGGGPY